MEGHTPTPWYVVPVIEADEGRPRRMKWPIFKKDGLYGHPATAHNVNDAEFIVHAANMHGQLVTTLTWALQHAKADVEGEFHPDDPVRDELKAAFDVLDRARKEQG